MKKISVVLVLLGICFSICYGGGELGNAIIKKFYLVGVELTYPKEWSELQTDILVSLQSPESFGAPEGSANYNVVKLELSEIYTLENLEAYLKALYLDQTWLPAVHKGVQGFKGSPKELQNLEYISFSEFYFLNPGTVIRISYQLTAEHLPEVTAIHQNLNWLP